MNVNKQIEQQERELKDLLHAVMREPLAPVLASVSQLQERVDDLEQQLQDAHQTELGILSMGTADIEKQIRLLKARVDATPEEVRQTAQQLRGALESGTLAAIGGKVTQLSEQLESGMGNAASHNARMQHDVAQLDGKLARQMKVQQEALELVHGIEQQIVQAAATLTQLSHGGAEQADNLTKSITRLQQDLLMQQQATQRAVDALRGGLGQQDEALRRQSAAGLQAAEQLSADQAAFIMQSNEGMQAVVAGQQLLLQSVCQQQDAVLARLDQLNAAGRWLRPALTTALVLAAAACAGVAALLLFRPG